MPCSARPADGSHPVGMAADRLFAGDQIGDEEEEEEEEDLPEDESKLVQKVNRRQKADEVDDDSD
jgi:hypothetical protein